MPKHVISFTSRRHRNKGIPAPYIQGIIRTDARTRGSGLQVKQTGRRKAYRFEKKPQRVVKFLEAWLEIHYPGHPSRFRAERVADGEQK